MSINTDNQLLRDPDIVPTPEIIAESLKDTNNAFVEFTNGLKMYDISLMEWRYYNDGKAWLSKGEHKWTTARGANKVNPIFWLSIWDGFFKVTFFFSESAKDELLSLPVSQFAKEAIKNAKPLGKTMRMMPVVFDITDGSQLSDVYELAKFKKSIK